MSEEFAVGDEIVWKDPIGNLRRGIIVDCRFINMHFVVDELDMQSGHETGHQYKVPPAWIESSVTDTTKKRSFADDYDRAMSII